MSKLRVKRTLERKENPWTLKRADREFAAFIRERDGKCVRCGAKPPSVQLQCSHFWGRGRKNTRFDPENCDALCATCHYWGDSKRGLIPWEDDKQGDYQRFKQQQLGQERYEALEARAKVITQQKLTILTCKEFLAKVDKLVDVKSGPA